MPGFLVSKTNDIIACVEESDLPIVLSAAGYTSYPLSMKTGLFSPTAADKVSEALLDAVAEIGPTIQFTTGYIRMISWHHFAS